MRQLQLLSIGVLIGIIFFNSGTCYTVQHPLFVIQKYEAMQSHYDIRFEINGTLESWSLPKDPPLKQSKKRLAIPAGKHPLSYATFEGIMPSGSYGAGTVMVWDIGTFRNITTNKNGRIIPLSQCIKRGRLNITLDGKKLRGDYALVKKTHQKNKTDWLFFKMKGGEKRIIKRKNRSAISGRTMQQIAAETDKIKNSNDDPFELLPNSIRNSLQKAKHQQQIKPMLPSLSHDMPDSDAWIYERKFDGQRCICVKRGTSVTLFSRNKKKINNSYPELVDALQQQQTNAFIIDGEIVAFDGDKTSFGKLQERMFIANPDEACQSPIKVTYCIFDILQLQGLDLCPLPLTYRKKLLAKAISFVAPLQYVNSIQKNGQHFFERACKAGWEGVVAKKASSTYQQKRSKDWLKLKCSQDMDLVIGGYTNPRGKRKGFGALLLGYYNHKSKSKLCYAGKVGTGFSEKMLLILSNKLKPLKQKKSPFKDKNIPTKGVHWVKPSLVVSVAYKEMTKAGKLRAPRFLGLRTDKKASDITHNTLFTQQ